MQKEFYLSSHDFGPPARPLKCHVVNEATGLRRAASYLVATVDPPLVSRFQDGPTINFERAILSVIGGAGLESLGAKPVSVEIVLCPSYSGGAVDESKCAKIGMGGLHLTYADALAHSPADTAR